MAKIHTQLGKLPSEALGEDLRKAAGSLDRTLSDAALAAALALGALSNARAQVMEPLSYTNAPIGLNFLIAGYGYQWGDVLVDPSLPIKDSDAKVHTAVLAYARVLDFWGQSGTFALIVPYAWLSATGEVAGPILWAALDATYYTGGRTSVNGALNNDLQENSRWGATLAQTLDKHNSIKLYFNSGVTAGAPGSDTRAASCPAREGGDEHA